MGGNSLKHLNQDLIFLKSGLTKADLNSFGKEPVLRDRFTIRAIMVTILLIQRGNRLEGIWLSLFLEGNCIHDSVFIWKFIWYISRFTPLPFKLSSYTFLFNKFDVNKGFEVRGIAANVFVS